MSKDSIISVLKENNPHLSISSLYSYSSLLSALHKKVFRTNDIDIDNFKNVEQIMEGVKDRNLNSRKTVLSALYVLTKLPEYHESMMTDIVEYKEDVAKREMNDKQKQAYKTQDEINDVFLDLQAQSKILYRKPEKSNKDIQTIQNYIIMCLASGRYIPPRRSLDWVNMKISDINKSKDNYIAKNQFIFNSYKGSASKGQQTIPIPPDLKAIIKKWIALNESSDYLLFDSNYNKLNSVKFNQRLSKCLGKGSSVNVLRHSYLSEKFQESIPMQDKLSHVMQQMGSSTRQQNIYIQKLNSSKSPDSEDENL